MGWVSWLMYATVGSAAWLSTAARKRKRHRDTPSNRMDRRVFKRFARRHDLTFDTGRHNLPVLTGRHEGLQIRTWVHRAPGRRGILEVSFEVYGVPDGLSVHLAAPDEGRGPDPLTGDETFDALAHIGGDPWVVHASLTEEAREAVAELLGLGGAIANGRAMLTVHGGGIDEDDLRELSDTVFQAARALRHDPDQRLDRLGAIFAHDSDPEVRAQALHQLALRGRQEPWVNTALEHALASRTAPLCTGVAAHHFKRAEVLVELADPQAYPHPVVLGALRALKGDWAVASWREALTRVVRDGDAALVTAALHHAASLPPAERGAILAAVVTTASQVHRLRHDMTVQGAIAWLVQRVDPQADPTCEQALVAAVGHPGRDVWSLALDALAARGSARAVEGLLDHERDASRIGSRRRAIRRTIDQLQAALQGAEAGRVSLVSLDARGALSMSEAASSGGVSLADPDP